MNKARGDLAESIFQTEALSRGLVPHFPFGDWLPHDIVLFNPKTGKFFRVQIKSTDSSNSDTDVLRFSVCKGSKDKASYTATEVDTVALHCFTTKEWYIVPIAEIRSRKTLSMAPGNKLLNYRDNWAFFNQT